MVLNCCGFLYFECYSSIALNAISQQIAQYDGTIQAQIGHVPPDDQEFDDKNPPSLLLLDKRKANLSKKEHEKCIDESSKTENYYLSSLGFFVQVVVPLVLLYQAKQTEKKPVQFKDGKPFVMMRTAEHNQAGKLTKAGKRQVSKASQAIESLAEKNGLDSDDVKLVHSGELNGILTAKKVAKKLEDADFSRIDTLVDPRLQGNQNGELLESLKKTDTAAYEKFQRMTPEEQFDAKPVEGYKSDRETFNRINATIQDNLDKAHQKTLTVFITQEQNLFSWLQGLVFSGEITPEQIPESSRSHPPASGEIFPMRQLQGVIVQDGERTGLSSA
jgi:hypothetical protein